MSNYVASENPRRSRAKASGGRKSDVAARHALLQVALELFSRKGFADASVREIVTGAGVTAPTLYYYFNSKEGVYVHLLEDCSRRFQEAITASTVRPGRPAERLLALTEGQFEFARHHRNEVRFLFGVLYGPREQTPFVDFGELMGRYIGPVEAVFREAAPLSHGRTPEDAAISHAGMMTTWTQRFLYTGHDVLTLRRAASLVSLSLPERRSAKR